QHGRNSRKSRRGCWRSTDSCRPWECRGSPRLRRLGHPAETVERCRTKDYRGDENGGSDGTMTKVEEKKKAIRERFDTLAGQRERWQRKSRYYYQDQQRYFRFLVPEGLRVLEVGCGLGDLLATLKPA